MSLTTLASNPFRVPDWRWQRATTLVDRPGRCQPASRRLDGPDGYKWINHGVRFLREYKRGAAEDDLSGLASRRPSLFWAYQIWLSDNPTKTFIEAHLLARSEDHYIAFRANTTPETIRAYEAMFFNVRPKLHHQSYILNCVIGPEVHTNVSEREYRLLWKLYGYFLGPHIVDALEAKFINPIWCSSPADLNAAVMDDAISTLKFKAAIAAKSLQVNQYTQLAILETFTKFIEIERNTDSAGKAQDQILTHISAMMTTLPFAVGGRDSAGRLMNTGTPIAEYEQSAIELTYEESVRIATNQPIVHADIIKSLRYPDAVSDPHGGVK